MREGLSAENTPAGNQAWNNEFRCGVIHAPGPVPEVYAAKLRFQPSRAFGIRPLARTYTRTRIQTHIHIYIYVMCMCFHIHTYIYTLSSRPIFIPFSPRRAISSIMRPATILRRLRLQNRNVLRVTIAHNFY